MRDCFDEKEKKILKSLSTPVKIQDFLDTLPRNMEKKGDTLMSPRVVLRQKKAHCIESALLAAAAFWYHGKEPWVMDLRASKEDYDHVIAVYERKGYYGAISKTNHAGLRWRDPVYKNIRELAMSYFHEYLDDIHNHKTLRAYSGLINLKKFGKKWLTDEEDLFDIALKIDGVKHFPVAPASSLCFLRPADKIECLVNRIQEWKKADKRT